MKNLRNKMKKQGGFTLIEMLIVVAIIAILVAVSIPVVTTALERARNATDAANERAAKAELMIQYLSDSATGTKSDVDEVYFYDAANGKLIKNADYGSVKSTLTKYGKCSEHKDGIIKLHLNPKTGDMSMAWVTVNKTGEPMSTTLPLHSGNVE